MLTINTVEPAAAAAAAAADAECVRRRRLDAHPPKEPSTNMRLPPTSSFLRALWVTWALCVSTNALAVSGGQSSTDKDPAVQHAERTLRAAELRSSDDGALELYQSATEEARACLARNPNSAGANFVYFAAKGRLLMADGSTKNLLALRRLDKDYLDRALELDPNYANALAAKGGILLDLPRMIGGDPKEGLRLLRKAKALNPGGVGTRVNLAKALALNGDTKGAREEAILAAHYACIQGRRKALDQAVEILEELQPTVARADHR